MRGDAAGMSLPRHCDEQSDEAILGPLIGYGLLRFARAN